MLGAHSTGTAAFRFENVRLRGDQLMVPPPGAFSAALEAIDLARVVAAMCIGMLQRGLDIAVGYVSNRQAFGKPLSEQQGLRWMLADVATDLEAAKALGANGFRQDRSPARHLAASKMAQYLDGTTEIQNVVNARSLFGS